MFLLTRRFSFLVIMITVSVSVVFAQNQTSRRDMTVEESYLQESIEMMIIRETARTNTREQKLIALEYISDAIDQGRTNPEIAQTLGFLSMEGRMIQSRENGRLINNFPEVRRQAAKQLGRLGTEEAVEALLNIVRYENEPMVLQEAIKSLGDIGINNENNDTVRFIAHTVRHNNNTNPDNLMALATIDAFEKLAKNNNGLNSPEAVQVLVLIAENYRYATPVRERSRQALAELRTYGR
ncbi:MAG: HEAT repeat domain-containing protein [Treponema sp.]|jgi:HEAT repeat protein|nr:HEAT repeat domain-containing protein [Treponema sp.]